MLSCIRLLIVLWCSAKTRKINLMVHYGPVCCVVKLKYRSLREVGIKEYTPSTLLFGSRKRRWWKQLPQAAEQ